MKPFKTRAKEAKRRWDSEAGLLRDAETLRLIVKHRLSICAPVLPSHPDWNAFSGDGGNDSYGRTIHVAVRRAAKEVR